MFDLLAAAGINALYTSDFYQKVLEFDASILLYVQEFIRNDILTPLMKFITLLGDGGVFWIVLTVVLLCIPKTRKMGLCSAIALLLSVIICNVILKNAFARIRPYEVIEEIELLVKRANDWSFPSGHTSASVAAAVALFLASTKKQKFFTVWGIVLAAAIGFSRIYVGIHYPTDVFVSAFMAIILAVVATLIGEKLYDFLALKFTEMKKKKAEAKVVTEPETEAAEKEE